jgi:nucleoside phosphorylase
MPTARRVDVAIITVLPIELHAVLASLKVDPKIRLRQNDGGIFYEATIYSRLLNKELALIITCIGSAGQAMASSRTTSVIEQFDPAILILVGIAAGMRDKLRIGDVIVPKTVVDLSSIVAKPEGTVFRARISEQPFPIQQMIPGFTLENAAFHGRCQELFGDPIKAPPGEEVIYEKHVTFKPRVADDALASADTLLKVKTAFPDMQRQHEKIRAAEMEAGGFLIACSSRAHPSSWLVVRGISDFGDELKDDYFHKLAACAAAAWLTFFLEDGFDLENLRPSPEQPIKAASSGQNPELGIRQTAAHLTPVITDVINSHLERLSLVTTSDRQRDLEEIREEWRTNQGALALEKLRSLKIRADWSVTSKEVRASILRFEAALELSSGKNAVTAEAILKQARDLDPSIDTQVLSALILFYRDKDREGALKLLEFPKTQESWNLHLGILADRREWLRLLTESQTPPNSFILDAETRRLRTLAYLHRNQKREARQEIEIALQLRPNWFHLRLVDAILAYFESLSEPMFEMACKNWPEPAELALVKRDKVTLDNLNRAEKLLEDLGAVAGLSDELRREIEGWRLGCLANNPERQNEAKSYCSALLERSPSHHVALAWATSRDYADNLGGSVNTLFDQFMNNDEK